ncbi:ATP-dependent RNA helicase DbpA [Budviciaceae bacterium BWR-B9]|uniref:ATP-dependent RNA helicase DbpA n=1 Tax=Limnobaculum allomyrinae TaxID=2791986 RepID=A0ABS1IM63_9GAMM|nr:MULTISPECIES: ATP-dependent RNA helicase DbpA [Limnobaculum]MBK5142435.1 ATP-dependent RNA helicase DbpA [Limnobaculum allomyrinae]MBV7690680.1 ATP-dependent RNA helicase DbpA [Limnobaculum sp. M2-1]
MSTTLSFSELPLDKALIDNLHELGYAQMTPIQAAALPVILQGKDVVAQAKTGSGKTAAFGIGLLSAIQVDAYRTQALILCPTRELADQVSKELRRLARAIANIKVLTLCGGQPMGAQVDSLAHPAHIIVGTPGRIQDHLRKGNLTLHDLNILVLDEADRMLDMGFSDEVNDIISHTPSQRQTLLFSATYPVDIEKMSERVQHSPERIIIESADDRIHIEQQFIEVTTQQRISLLQKILSSIQPESCVVFSNTKRDCQEIAETLSAAGSSVLALHGDLEQRDRERVLVQFANQSCRVLVATDVAARGLDIKDLPLVVNFELPFDPEVYIHRIGRTGRAGAQGMAISFCTLNELQRAHAIEDYLSERLEWKQAERFNHSDVQPVVSNMLTLSIDGGRKAKVRPGDILGALTGDAGLTAADVGKIAIFDTQAYVAIRRQRARFALEQLRNGKIKGKNCRVWLIK